MSQSDINKEITRLIKAQAVKLNLNACKEFARANGYVNEVDKYQDNLIAEIQGLGLKGQAVIDYMQTKYMAGHGARPDKINKVSALFEDDGSNL